MPPIPINDLVVGDSYYRINRRTGEVSIVAKFIGIKIEPITTFAMFSSDHDVIVWDNIEMFDMYADGVSSLNTEFAGRIGDPGLDLANEVDAITHEPFLDGDDCVRLLKRFVYHTDALQAWFDTGRTEEPLTRLLVRQSDLERFTYFLPQSVD